MKFSFYTVDTAYCDFLREVDSRVPHTMLEKEKRPFVGIVLEIGSFQYFAPLTSPKRKHLQMKNQVDFLKIKGGEWGAINFNNMIPVSSWCLHEVDMRVHDHDSSDEKAYKRLLANQLTWCNENRGSIIRKAGELYRLITGGQAWDALAKRCCDFRVVEEQSQRY